MIAWHRLGLIWIGLLGVIQSTDIITTAMGRARGAVEAMPISAAVMNEGGMMLFVFVKFALVLAGAAAVLLTLAVAGAAYATRLNPLWLLLAGGILGFAGVI